MLVESRDSTCVLKAEPGKLDINRPIPGITFIRLPFGSVSKMSIMAQDASYICCKCL